MLFVASHAFLVDVATGCLLRAHDLTTCINSPLNCSTCVRFSEQTLVISITARDGLLKTARSPSLHRFPKP